MPDPVLPPALWRQLRANLATGASGRVALLLDVKAGRVVTGEILWAPVIAPLASPDASDNGGSGGDLRHPVSGPDRRANVEESAYRFAGGAIAPHPASMPLSSPQSAQERPGA